MDAGCPLRLFFLPNGILGNYPGNVHGRWSAYFVTMLMLGQKKERLVGGPAARAWEWRVRGLKSVRFFISSRKARGRPFRCAREQQDDAQEQTPDNHPNGSEGRTYFRSLCDFAERTCSGR